MSDILDLLGGAGPGDIAALIGGDDGLITEPTDVPAGAVLKMEAKRRVCFDLTRSVHTLLRVLDAPPARDECFKLLSDAGGWSSCSLIMWLAQKEPIVELYCSTFRVGTKEIGQMERLREVGKLGPAQFVLSGLVEWDDARRSEKYDYYAYFRAVCDRNGWRYASRKNHSKVILARTRDNWYVIETSSNLNENPKIEQFSFENDEALFEFYRRNLFEGGDGYWRPGTEAGGRASPPPCIC